MNKESKNALTKFILWFAERYHQLKTNQKENDPNAHVLKYKIGCNYEEYKKSGKLLIQARKGSAYLYLTPKQVCDDAEILSYLHPIDASIVTTLLMEQEREHAPFTYRLVRYYQSIENNLYLYEVEDLKTGEVYEYSQKEFIDNPDIISKFNGKDAMSIGWEIGVEYEKTINKIKSDVSSSKND